MTTEIQATNLTLLTYPFFFYLQLNGKFTVFYYKLRLIHVSK